MSTTQEIALPSAARNEERMSLRQSIEAQRSEFARGLPAHIDVDRFVRGALNALQATPKLAACTKHSILSTLSQAAQLGLEVNDVRGQCYLIPRKGRRQLDNGTWVDEQQATLQLGWKGLIDLAARSGIIVEAGEIRERDQIDWQLGTASRLTLRPVLGDRGGVIGYYSAAQFVDGRSAFEVMSLAEMVEHRDKFASDRDFKTKAIKGPWVDHFDAMARKTVIRKLLNRLPQAVEFSRADAIETASYEPTPSESVPALPANVDRSTGEIAQLAASSAEEVTRAADGDVIDAEVIDAPPVVDPDPTPPSGSPRNDTETPIQIITRLGKAHGVEGVDNLLRMAHQVTGVEHVKLSEYKDGHLGKVVRILRDLREDEVFVFEGRVQPSSAASGDVATSAPASHDRGRA